MQQHSEPQVGNLYVYDHNDYTNIALCFKKVRDMYYFIELDNGADPSKLWVNLVRKEDFELKFTSQEYVKDSWWFDCFFDALENLRQNHVYYPNRHYTLTPNDYIAIDNAVSIFRVMNHIKDDYGNHKSNYNEYMQSSQWRQIRATMLSKYGKCQLCGSTSNLEVHHNSYEHIGDEMNHLEDLVVLCRDCHSSFHSKRQ